MGYHLPPTLPPFATIIEARELQHKQYNHEVATPLISPNPECSAFDK